MLRKTLILVLAISPLLSAQNERITITGQSSYGGKKSVLNAYALLCAKLGDDDQVLLTCELSHEDCIQLALGQYEIARLIPGEGSYKDCSNIDIYRIGANRLKEKPLGEYCLEHLQD
jgi:hypothetical protein